MPYKISITAPERSFNEYISNPRKAFIDHNKKCQPIYMAGILLIISNGSFPTAIFGYPLIATYQLAKSLTQFRKTLDHK